MKESLARKIQYRIGRMSEGAAKDSLASFVIRIIEDQGDDADDVRREMMKAFLEEHEYGSVHDSDAGEE